MGRVAGWVLLAAVFAGIYGLIASAIGWARAVAVLALSAVVTGVVVLAVGLITGEIA